MLRPQLVSLCVTLALAACSPLAADPAINAAPGRTPSVALTAPTPTPATATLVSPGMPTLHAKWSTEDAPDYASPSPSPTPGPPNPSATPSILPITALSDNPLQDGQFIATLFWSEDGDSLYFAVESPPSKALRWRQLGVVDGEDRSIYGPPYSSRAMTYFGLQYGIEGFDGTTSHSGRYYLASRTSGANREQLWLVDSQGQPREMMLVDGNPDYVLKGAQWANDDTLLVFAWGPSEWGRDLFLVDVSKRKTTILPTGNVYPSFFQISPDASMIAAFDPTFNIALIKLPRGEIVELTSPYIAINWSHDSRRLYGTTYAWDGSTYHRGLRNIDLSAWTECTLLEDSDFTAIEAAGISPINGFDISPDQSQLAFWDVYGHIVLLPVPQAASQSVCSSLPS